MRLPLLSACGILALASSPLAAQQGDAPSNEELARRIDLLAAQQGDTVVSSPFGSKASFGGYGELTYRNFDGTTDGGAPSGMTDELDLHRVVFYFGYQFNDTWSFNSEIEYEHTDELAVEFAQIDGHFSDALNFRGGHLLMPVGFVNQMHEPTTFWSARRPLVERYIIPSTWHENGAGTFGSAGDFQWQAYVVNGFDAAGFDPGSSGLRGGRQGGDKAAAEDFALTGRLDWHGVDGLLVGASFFQGDSGQSSGVSDFGVSLFDIHAQYDHGPLRLRFLYADATIDDASLLPTPSASDDLMGWYLEGGYDIFADCDNGQSLTPFVRFENFDLLDATAASTDVDVLVVGVAWQPQENLTFKLDFQDQSNDADTTVDTVEFTLGWAF
ncbi:MAG: hypothetical protein ACYTEP_04690 [Planctomycetota bacterium]|jgi:hypothetical protein